MRGDIADLKTVVLSTHINQNGYGSSQDFNLGGMGIPSDMDLVRIKNISLFNTASTEMFFIQSDLTNGIIASACVEVTPSQHNPDITIDLKGRTPSSINFYVKQLSTTNIYIASTIACVLSVSLEFVKFKKE